MNAAHTADAAKPYFNDDRLFSPEPTQRRLAQELYATVQDLPLICPHGHVDPRLFADESSSFGSPAELFIIPDHYVFRMLYSQGVPLEALGIPHRDGGATETDHRKIWRLFCEKYYLFRGTPSGLWLRQELADVFGIFDTPNAANADALYDEISAKLATPEFHPRALYEKFNIEVLCTTDAATDTLEHHKRIRESGWKGRILPTFRPDAVINPDAANWRENIDALSIASGIEVKDYKSFIAALENRRAFFKEMGATATDHGAVTADTFQMPNELAETMFQKALKGDLIGSGCHHLSTHLLTEMARMSSEDGLVMQLHVGSVRNHNRELFERFGPDKGADIPKQTEYTFPLGALLTHYGNNPNLTLILFTLDESTYSRELAPLAGHYPALRLGPPWWFHDSPNGMTRYLDGVLETAGVHNLAGFNDDTRAFCSIPARHDVWRRVVCDYLAGLTVRGIVTDEDAQEMALDLSYRLAKSVYKL